MQAAFLFTVVGTTGFLGVLAGQLPGVGSLFYLLARTGVRLLRWVIGCSNASAGLGILCALLDWEYLAHSFGRWKHLTRVSYFIQFRFLQKFT